MTILPLIGVGATALGVLGVIGGGLVYLRSGFVKERDLVRTSTIEGLRELAATQEAICEAEKRERDTWIERLEHHHDTTHRNCRSGPSRDG